MPEVIKTYDDLLALIKTSERDFDLELINRAYELAKYLT